MICPGSTIGILGSGQLGRMTTIAAKRMGYRVHTLSPDTDTPTGQVCDLEVVAAYDDIDAVEAFASNVDVVTFEFENVLAVTAEAAARHAPVRPSGHVLHTTQHRLREKTFLSENGFPVTPYRRVAGVEALSAAINELGTPCVLKSAGWGYDGKGQFKITSPDQAAQAWAAVNVDEAVLEAFVDFDREVSIIAARSPSGETAVFELAENLHTNHILDISIAPCDVPDTVRRQASDIVIALLDKFDYVGLLCVEFFLTRDNTLLINELAPRPHNSGHLTFDASLTSQFEQHVRAICGLPLGDTRLVRPAAMANLLGDVWQDGVIPAECWSKAMSLTDVKFHLYGKAEARVGRKMGHLTALADDVSTARDHAVKARDLLRGGSG